MRTRALLCGAGLLLAGAAIAQTPIAAAITISGDRVTVPAGYNLVRRSDSRVDVTITGRLEQVAVECRAPAGDAGCLITHAEGAREATCGGTEGCAWTLEPGTATRDPDPAAR